jgi:hypothetical protein
MLATLDLFALVNGILCHINEPGRVHRHHEGGLHLALPQELHIPALEECHDSIATGGHHGTDKTYLKLCERYWWPDCYEMMCYWVESCKKCGSVNCTTLQKRKSRMQQDLLLPLGSPQHQCDRPSPPYRMRQHPCLSWD